MTTAAATIDSPSPRNVALGPAIVTLAWRELIRFFRQRSRVIGALVQPIIFWLMFSEGLKSVRLGYAFQFPGILAMIVLFTAIFTTISIIEDRNAGFLQGVLVSPVPRWAMVLGKVLGGAIIAWLQAMLFLVLGWLTLSEIDPPWGELAAAVVLLFVLSVALTSLGFWLAWRSESTQGYHAMMSVLLFPMWLLSGAFFSPEPNSVMGWLITFNPLTYGVAALRHHLSGGLTIENGWLPSLPLSWGVTLLFAVAMYAVATRIAAAGAQGK